MDILPQITDAMQVILTESKDQISDLLLMQQAF